MENAEELVGLIRRLFDLQLFAGLATESDGQPYCNLVAFAASEDLRELYFVTPRNTRKYASVLAGKKVSFLVDDRQNTERDLKLAVAVTVIGTAKEVFADNRGVPSGIFGAKHPGLKEFLNNRANAIIAVAVNEYIVATFDKVRNLPVRQD